MFHTYVRATSGRQIDIDRAKLLMDDHILSQAELNWRTAFFIAQMPSEIESAERNGLPRPRPPERSQFVWESYCRLHKWLHGVPFEPDVSLTWDE